MSIIKRIKNWFKKEEPKEEPKEEYYIYYEKLRQRELDLDFSMINNSVSFITKKIPYRCVLHIEKCIDYNELDFAITHLRFWEKCCHWSFLNSGYKCDLEPLWEMIKESKQYKQRMLKEKLERMKKDFE